MILLLLACVEPPDCPTLGEEACSEGKECFATTRFDCDGVSTFLACIADNGADCDDVEWACQPVGAPSECSVLGSFCYHEGWEDGCPPGWESCVDEVSVCL